MATTQAVTGRLQRDGARGAVLVAVDGSDPARRALRWGRALAQVTDRPLRALAVTEAGWAEPGTDTEAALHAVVDQELGPTAEVTCGAAPGPPPDAVVAAASDGVDLVVLGSRGRSGILGGSVGTVTRACLERCAVPVVVVPVIAPEVHPGPWSLVVGHDGSPGSERAVAWAADVAEVVGSEIVLVRGFDELDVGDGAPVPPTRFPELAARGIPHRLVVGEDDPRHLLTRTAAEVDAHLVVVGRRGLSRISSLVVGSVSTFVVRHSSRPVVVVPTPVAD